MSTARRVFFLCWYFIANECLNDHTHRVGKTRKANPSSVCIRRKTVFCLNGPRPYVPRPEQLRVLRTPPSPSPDAGATPDRTCWHCRSPVLPGVFELILKMGVRCEPDSPGVEDSPASPWTIWLSPLTVPSCPTGCAQPCPVPNSHSGPCRGYPLTPRTFKPGNLAASSCGFIADRRQKTSVVISTAVTLFYGGVCSRTLVLGKGTCTHTQFLEAWDRGNTVYHSHDRPRKAELADVETVGYVTPILCQNQGPSMLKTSRSWRWHRLRSNCVLHDQASSV